MKKAPTLCPRCNSPLKGRTPKCLSCANTYVEKVDKFFVSIYNRIKLRHPSTNLTPQYLQWLFKEQRGLCGYTKLAMVASVRCPSPPTYCASLDRIDSKDGYVIDNVVWVILPINWMKNSLPHEEITELLKKIIKTNAKNCNV